MLATNRKTHANKPRNKTKKVSYKKQLQHEQIQLEADSCSFCKCLQTLQKNLSEVAESNFLANDTKFFRMCALLIVELYYKAKYQSFPPRIKKSAKQAIELLTKTFQTTSLLQAAYLFSEQSPQKSDLSALLTQLSLDKKEFLTQSFKIECLT